MANKTPLTPARFVVALIVFGVATYFGLFNKGGEPAGQTTTGQTQNGQATPAPAPQFGRTAIGSPTPEATTPSATGDGLIEQAFAQRRSDVLVENGGRVRKILPDDNEGSRHQKFIVELASGHTVLIAHNIDLAPRVPLDEGDRITFAGEYEYNTQGGVVHWTHHDPAGRHKGGWIEHDGTRYE